MPESDLKSFRQDVTVPRKPLEDFLHKQIRQLLELETCADQDRRQAIVESVIRECRDSLALFEILEKPQVLDRVSQIEDQIANGTLAPALPSDEIDAMFAAHLAK